MSLVWRKWINSSAITKQKLLGQMVESLGKSIISMYFMGVCAVLGMSNLDALSEDCSGDLRQGSSNNSVTNFVLGSPYIFQRET